MATYALADPTPDPTKLRLGAEADPRLRNTGLSDQLGFTLRIAQTAVWADLVATLAPFDLRPQQFAALLIIAANEGCKQRDIAAALGIQRPNIVALVDELVGGELVERRVAEGDRRSYSLTLAAKGAALLPRVSAAHREHLGRVEAAVAPADASEILGALQRLAAIGR